MSSKTCSTSRRRRFVSRPRLYFLIFEPEPGLDFVRWPPSLAMVYLSLRRAAVRLQLLSSMVYRCGGVPRLQLPRCCSVQCRAVDVLKQWRALS